MKAPLNILVIEPSGTMSMQSFTSESGLEQLEALQGVVGGYLEALQGHGWHAYLNEDGRAMGLDPNPVASTLLAELGVRVGLVVGTVMFLSDRNGDEISTPASVLAVAAQLGEIN